MINFLNILFYIIINEKSDIGILFDVSGSMTSPLKRISKNNSYKRSDEFLNFLENICDKGHKLKNEQFKNILYYFRWFSRTNI